MKVDAVSIRDLELMGIYEDGELHPEKGIFSIYNLARTKEGKTFVKSYFSFPSSDIKEIERRQKLLLYFVENIDHWEKLTSGMDFHEFDGVECYINSNLIDFFSKNKVLFLYRVSLIRLFYEDVIEEIITGIRSIIFLLQKANLILKLSEGKNPYLMKDKLELINSILEMNIFKAIQDKDISSFSIIRLLKIDHQIRFELKDKIDGLVKIVAEFEGRIALARAFIDFKLALPDFIHSDEPFMQAEGIFHPLVKKPVKNSITFSVEKNFLFLTGPNMAGKTTFLKAVGICIYLAHVGFGVPAESFKLSFFDNLITLMLSEENISKKESYFMSEVRRVKHIARCISEGKKCVILMDEIFKGTNFEDAYETTRAVISKMAETKNSIFILSTHIFELAEYMKNHKNTFFKCFDVSLEENKIKYHYSLTDGVSRTKLGMKILESEGVLETLNIRGKIE